MCLLLNPAKYHGRDWGAASAWQKGGWVVFPRVLWAPGFRKLTEIFPELFSLPPLPIAQSLGTCQFLLLVDFN